LLTITQPEQSGGTGQAQSLSRDSAGLRQEHLTVSHSVLDQEKGAAAGGKAAREKIKNEPVQSYTV
jgi:hypothetical protein